GSVSQELNAATYLGWSVDAESAMQYSANATGDKGIDGFNPSCTTIPDDFGARRRATARSPRS
ncbi:hypothetical protein CTI14_65075, partial [Methylobacterium radiotolerans]